MKFSLAISTCPNDTFIFDALVNKRIDTERFSFQCTFADIDQLNNFALLGDIDLVKISYAAYPYVSDKYQLLTSGSALGRGVGPLVVSKRKIYPDEIQFTKIAIPGERTTANLLFSMAFPGAKNKSVYLFSEIEDAVLSNDVDVGVIIHENRFTYQLKGLKKVVDLGNLWEEQTGLPIPLGGIAVKRDLDSQVKQILDRLVRESVEYAFTNPNHAYPFVREHAQSMELDVMTRHIDLYVNDFSARLGNEGKRAVNSFFKIADEQHFFSPNSIVEPIFVL